MLQDVSSKLPVVENLCSNTNAVFLNIADISIVSGGPSGYPRATGTTLASNSIRHSCVVWLYFDGMNQVVQAACGTGPLLSSPTDLSVVQNVTIQSAGVEFLMSKFPGF